MADLHGWYPPGQVCCPPDLPTYLKNICELKPIVGVPSDAEVMNIHSVMHAANRVSGVPGMHDAGLFMELGDHLFSVQMARYRSKYSLITFPSDATYTPPALPAHVTVVLDPVTGAPSNEEIMKVQDAVRSYQHFSSVPSMFDPLVNMELSQHLFDIQMARYIRTAGEIVSSPAAQTAPRHENSTQTTGRALDAADELTTATNNVGTGANVAEIYQTPKPVPTFDVNELISKSNQLAERFNWLLERSNELMERCARPADSQTLAEHFNQVLERFARILEPTRRPAESDRLAERFNQLLDRFNQLAEQLNQPARTANELSEKANRIAERANQLAEQAQKPVERLGGVLGNVNKVLVAIQHAIVRNHKDNAASAVDCLVNERGETPSMSAVTSFYDFRFFEECCSSDENQISVIIDGASQNIFIPDARVADFLSFYGIGKDLFEEESYNLREEMTYDARIRLGDYFSSRLG